MDRRPATDYEPASAAKSSATAGIVQRRFEEAPKKGLFRIDEKKRRAEHDLISPGRTG
jgi:hypothetical protein